MINWFRKLFTEETVSQDLAPPINLVNDVESLVDVREVICTVNCIQDELFYISNPLGTDFDLADIVMLQSQGKLISSPFLHTWPMRGIDEFNDRFGIWLTSTNESLVLLIGKGRSSFFKESAAFRSSDGFALFFVLPDEFINETDVQLKITVIYMN
jgi:hypothetical protein